MKYLFSLCTGFVILAVLISGCTSTSPQSSSSQSSSSQATTTAPALSFSGTTWKLGWFDDNKGVWSKVAEGSTITATFGPGTDANVNGFSGCNEYSTRFLLAGDKKIEIVRPAVPDKICQTPFGVMNQESAYYTDLEFAVNYDITNNQLVMFDKTGKKILQFDPV